MFRLSFFVAIRNLIQHKIFVLINILGLAIGISFSILSFTLVSHELTYDLFHDSADRIYRVYENRDLSGFGQFQRSGYVRIPLGPTLKEIFPEVEDFVRFTEKGRTGLTDGKKSISGRFYYVDPSIFKVFDFPLLWGHPETVLEEYNSIVLSERIAKVFFGNQNPIGKMLTTVGSKPSEFTVAGVVRKIPQNSSIQFDFLVPHLKLEGLIRPTTNIWNYYSYTTTFVKLRSSTQAQELETKLSSIVNIVQSESQDGRSFELHLQPLREMHLNPDIPFEFVRDPKYIYILSISSMLVLAIALINFLNISVGYLSKRVKEVGIRKIFGATRRQLILQFWRESFLLCLIALLVGGMLAEIFLPTFNMLSNTDLEIHYFDDQIAVLFFIGLVSFIGVIGGILPAMSLANLHPADILRRSAKMTGMSLPGRVLMVLQLILSSFFLICSLTLYKQFDLLNNKDLGFNPDHLVVVTSRGELNNPDVLSLFKEIVAQHSSIVSVSGSSGFLISPWPSSLGQLKDGTVIPGREFDVDYDYLKTMGFELKSGRNFSPDFPSDPGASMVVNEELVKLMNWTEPLGKRFPFEFLRRRESGQKMHTTRDPKVIGVVKNFHFQTLYSKVAPAILLLNPSVPYHELYIRIHPQNTSQTLVFLEASWKQLEPQVPFTYSFLTETLALQYQEDMKLGQIISYAAWFAIFLTCLGTCGLTALAVTRDTKEIAIRKVFGGSFFNIVVLFSMKSIWLIIIAQFIAWPVAYYTMEQWLQNFAYRIDLNLQMFISSGLLILVLVLIAVNLCVIKPARSNLLEFLKE